MSDAPVPYARPFIGREEEEAVLEVLRSGWLTTGAQALAFEKEFANFIKGPASTGLQCLAVNSATSGLHLAAEACGIKPGDLVFLPSLTFTATAEVIRYLDADPVFVDVKPGAFHIDPAALEHAIENTKNKGAAKAIMPVHYNGLPCDMDSVMRIAGKHGMKVIEDAAHSFPSVMEDGRHAGTIGDVGVFSFYANKTITTGEGGMIAVKDEALAKRMSVMRSHGIDRSVWTRYTDLKASWYYEVLEAGFKYNLPDILAALGRAQLARALDLLEMRVAIAAVYDDLFSNSEHFALPPTGAGDARHLYPLRLNLSALKISRDDFIDKLKEKGIASSVHYIPLHVMPFYKNRYNLNEDDFPQTMAAYKSEISLPIWPGMTEGQVSRVVEGVKSIAAEYAK
ncbi:MAG: DegT/DnrJ/EryC1/StrS family aminotransferase [Spirochaetes bacterium]|nr:DegT/DnrJ/EryC1/StrS family aminotransferase [Spirochaetota bacterium]